MPKPKIRAIKPSERYDEKGRARVKDPNSYGNRAYQETSTSTGTNSKQPSSTPSYKANGTFGGGSDRRSSSTGRSFRDTVGALWSTVKEAAGRANRRAEEDPNAGYKTDDFAASSFRSQAEIEEEARKQREAEERKRIETIGKETEKAYKPNEEQERFYEDARRYSAERNAAREREAAAEGTKVETPAGILASASTPQSTGSVNSPRGSVPKPGQTPEHQTDTGTGGVPASTGSVNSPTVSPKPETTKPVSGWEAFAGNDEDWEDGVILQPETEEEAQAMAAAGVQPEQGTFPGTDIPMEPSRVETQEQLVAQRNALQQQYSKLYTLIYGTGLDGHDFDASAYDRLEEIGNQIKALNAQIEGRFGNILSGATGQYLSGITDAERTLYQAGQGMRDTMTAEGLADAQHELDMAITNYEFAKEDFAAGLIDENELALWKDAVDRAQVKVDAFGQVGEAQRGATEATAQLADDMLARANEDIETAKAGLGSLGKAGIDIGTNVIQMGMDAGTAALTGGSTLGSMFLRTFGSSAQEARMSGADIDKQLIYGAVKGGIEVFTEKIFGGDAGIYGPGFTDDLTASVIARLTNSDTGAMLLYALNGAVQEGAEEVISDLLAPFAEQIINDQSIETWLNEGWPLDELLYDFMIGAAVGALGESTSLVNGRTARTIAEAREAQASVGRSTDSGSEVITPGGKVITPGTPADVLAGAATPAGPTGAAPAAEVSRTTDSGSEIVTPGGKVITPDIRARAEKVAETVLGRNADPEELAEMADAIAESLAETEETEATPAEAQTEGEAPEAPEELSEEERVKEEPKSPADALVDAATPEELGEKQKSREPQTPSDVLADTVAPKSGPTEVAPGEVRADKQAPDAPAEDTDTEAKRDRAAKYREAAKTLRETADSLKAAAETDPNVAEMVQGFLDQADNAEKEAARLESEIAETTKGPSDVLAEAVAGEPKEGPALKSPSEVTESPEAPTQAATPESTETAEKGGSEELNSDLRESSEPATIEEDIKSANEAYYKENATPKEKGEAHKKAAKAYNARYEAELAERRAAGEEGLPDVDDYVGRMKELSKRADKISDETSPEFKAIADEMHHLHVEYVIKKSTRYFVDKAHRDRIYGLIKEVDNNSGKGKADATREARTRLGDIYDAAYRLEAQELRASGYLYLPKMSDHSGRFTHILQKISEIESLIDQGLFSRTFGKRLIDDLKRESEFMVYRKLDADQKAGKDIGEWVSERNNGFDSNLDLFDQLYKLGAIPEEKYRESFAREKQKKADFNEAVNVWKEENNYVEGKGSVAQPGPTAVSDNAGADEANQQTGKQPQRRRTNPRMGERFKPRTEAEQQQLRKTVKENKSAFRQEIENEIVNDVWSSLLGLHPKIVDVNSLPNSSFKRGWQSAIQAVQKKLPGVEIITVRDSAIDAYATRRSDRYLKDNNGGKPLPGTFAIVVDLDNVVNYIQEQKRKYGRHMTLEQVLTHEMFHAALGQSGYKAVDVHEWFVKRVKDRELIRLLIGARDSHAFDFHSGNYVPGVEKDVKGGAANVDMGDKVMQAKDGMWDEVFADLVGHIDRAFKPDGKTTSPRFGELVKLAEECFGEMVMPAYRYNEGIDNGTKQQGIGDRGWAGSYEENDPGAPADTGEHYDDDMGPLNEGDREREANRKVWQEEEAKARFGEENHERASKALDKLRKWAGWYTENYGRVAEDEHGEPIQDGDGNPVYTSAMDPFIKNVEAFLKGEQNAQALRDYYEKLRPGEGEGKGTDENWLYEPAIAEALEELANAEYYLTVAENNSGDKVGSGSADFVPAPSKDAAKEAYKTKAEKFARVFERVMERKQDNFDAKVKANKEIRDSAKSEGTGRAGERATKRENFFRKQMRPDTFFYKLGEFTRKKGSVTRELGDRTVQGEIDQINAFNGALSHFRNAFKTPALQKAWADVESGKTKGRVDILGLGKMSMNTELALLKTLETNGSLDHIARFGALFANEADYYAGRNNNGWGETEGYQVRLTPDALSDMAKDRLKAAGKKLSRGTIYGEKIKILKELSARLRADVMSNPVTRAAYEASTKAMVFMANQMNPVTMKLYGIAKALQGETYWPMEVVGKNNNAQYVNNFSLNLEGSRFLQHRKGSSGALRIRPFAEAAENYIDAAARFVGFGELQSDLEMMAKEMAVGRGELDKMSLQSTIQKYAGKSAAEWMTRYMETLSGTRKTAVGAGLRGALAQSALIGNPGVALKQGASYMNAAGVLDMDILLKNRLLKFGWLRSNRSYRNSALIQAINKNSQILESRRADNVVLKGEANSDSVGSKVMKFLPGWLKNWIPAKDYQTIANLAMACADQVKRNNPGIDTKSDEFYKKTAELLEKVTVKTQPIYDPEFRPDYLRSDNPYERAFAMFRTQHSQNLNQLMQANGELAAAKREGGDVKAAKSKVTQTVSGFVAAQVMFSVLQSAAKILSHRTKDYEDEDGNFLWGKAAKRFGLDLFESAAGVVWFGDTAAKLLVDAGTGVYSWVTGNKDARTSESTELTDNTISVITSLIKSTITVLQNPTAKNVKSEVFNISQAGGIPARNLYNLFNAAFMYGVDAQHKNLGNYDDVIDMLQTQHGMSDDARATQTTNAAVGYFKKGESDRAEALLATLDYSDSTIRSNVKTAAGRAYVSGEIDEATYKHILRDFVNEKPADIEKDLKARDLDMRMADIKDADPKKYDALVQTVTDAKDHATNEDSKSDLAARAILDAAMSKTDTDTFMEKYTGAGYYKAYQTVRTYTDDPERAVEILAGIDTNHNDEFAQDELYAYYKSHIKDKLVIKALWLEKIKAGTWKQTFDEYVAEKAKTAEYDAVKAENADDIQFGEAEKQLKELKSSATMHVQTQGNDPEMYKVISSMGLSEKDTDTVVDKYISAKSKTNYHALRDAGYSPDACFKVLTLLDSDGNGTIKKKDLYEFYKSHKGSDAIIKALFAVQGYTKNKRPLTWKEFKSGK